MRPIERGGAIAQPVRPSRGRCLRLTTAAALIGAFVFAAASAAASASSLVYIKGGRPYISATDGSDAHLVTNDQPGQWSLVTATDTGTVFAGRSDGSVQAYAPGAAGTNESVSSGLQVQDLDVAPDGSALAWMVLTHSALDPSELVHDSEVQQLTGGSANPEFLAEYWPAFASPTDSYMAGSQGVLHYDPTTNLQARVLTLPSGAAQAGVLEFVVDSAGSQAALRLGGSVEDFPISSCPAGETCSTSSSTLMIAAYANGQVVAACDVPAPFVFQKLSWSADGTLLAWEEPDGIHEMRIAGGTVDPACNNTTNLGLVVPGGSSPDFTAFTNRAAFPYTGTSGGGGTGNGGGTGGGGQGKPGNSKRPVDAITKISLLARTVRSGRPVRFVVTLNRAAGITVTLMRHVAATGHGKRHHPAREVALATSIVHRKPGKNSFALAKIHHHALTAGRYLLRITADGKPHTLSFTVRPR
jgi:hypothetical protein